MSVMLRVQFVVLIRCSSFLRKYKKISRKLHTWSWSYCWWNNAEVSWSLCSTTVYAKQTNQVGIRCFNLADSSNCYILNVLPYMGWETLNTSTTSSELPQPARVVMHLAEPYLDKGRHLFTDRYYSSIPLAKALENRNTSITGTIVKNRIDLPDETYIRKVAKWWHFEMAAFWH